MIKVGVLTCVWKRHELFIHFCLHWHLLKLKFPNIDFVFLAVGSDGDESENIVRSCRFNYLDHENNPVGAKWNAGAFWFQDKNIDYLLCLGSDDFLCEKTMLEYQKQMIKKVDFIGLLDCYLYDSTTKSSLYFEGYDIPDKSVGIGRCLSRKLLHEINYTPWKHNFNSRLDGSMDRKLRHKNYSKSLLRLTDFGGVAVDVKTETNITKFPIEHHGNTHNEKIKTSIHAIRRYL